MKMTAQNHADFSRHHFFLHQGLPALLTVLIVLPGISQAQPPITPSGLHTQVSDAIITGPNTQYDITGGTRPGGVSGTNLFHSFGDFGVPTNNIANFQNGVSFDLAGNSLPAGLTTSNILARVTGDFRSDIFGTIQTTGFGNANFFLMNPHGFLFGQNAIVNVGGMVTFTSADYLRLTDNAQFNAIPNAAADALLTFSPVTAFGFLGTNPGAITVQGSRFTVTEGQSISLVGGTISIESGTPEGGTTQAAQLSAPKGNILLASAASPGEFDAATLQSLPNMDGASFTSFGSVTLTPDSSINVSGASTVSIRSGHFVLSVNDAVLTTSQTPGSPETLSFSSGSSIVTSNSGPDPGAEVQLFASHVQMDGASISSTTTGDGSGGNLTIQGRTGAGSAAETVTLSNSSSVLAFGFGAGTAGDIAVVSPTLTMKDASFIATGSFGDGNAGDITINVGTLDLANASIQSIATAGGRGGDIGITSNGFTSNSYTVSDGGFVSTDAFSVGAAGNITLNAGSLTLNAGEIHTATGDAGSAGNISITTTEAVSLLAEDSFSRISSFSTGTGPTGDVTLQVGSLNISQNSSIEILSAGGGTTGTLHIDSSGPIAVSGVIANIPFLGTLSSPGPIEITAPTITMNNGTIVTSNSGESRAGDIQLLVGTLHMGSGSSITAETIGPGQGGDISIAAEQSVSLTNGSNISASSSSAGNAGSIDITATNGFTMQNSSITTEAGQGASGGNIKITTSPAATVWLQDSTISASVADGPGGGGNISIDPQFVILQNSKILATAEGQGGTITIITNLFLQDANSIVSADSGSGLHGTVTIQSPNSPISGQIQPLGKTPLIATALLNQRCASLAGGEFSSFTVAGRDSLPTEPGSWLASPLYAAGVGPGVTAEGGKAEDERLETPLLSLRQIAPAGFLTQAFAVDRSASCQS